MPYTFLQQPAVKTSAVFFSNFLQSYIVISGLFYFIISWFWLKKSKQNAFSPLPYKKIAIILPAHDEENVIGPAIESLQKLDYPKDKFSIFIGADHCSDKTVSIAREHNVEVFEYSDPSLPRGKGYVIDRITRNLLARGAFDVFCYFDADSLAHPDFLNAVSWQFNTGAQAMQGIEVAKNPNDNWITRILSVGQTLQNTYYQIAKHNLGMSATLHGKGMCFSGETMARFRWNGECLTEDIDMQAQLVAAGVRIRYAQEAIVYDEEPSKMMQLVYRNIRWTKGGLDVARRYLWKFLVRSVKTGDKSAIENFFRFSGSFRMIFVTVIIALMYFYWDSFNLLYWIFDHPQGARFSRKFLNWVPLWFVPLAALWKDRAAMKDYAAYFLTPYFYFQISAPIFIVSLFGKKRTKNWHRTEHTSALRISDMPAVAAD